MMMQKSVISLSCFLLFGSVNVVAKDYMLRRKGTDNKDVEEDERYLISFNDLKYLSQAPPTSESTPEPTTTFEPSSAPSATYQPSEGPSTLSSSPSQVPPTSEPTIMKR
jgi:hypothetical protein